MAEPEFRWRRKEDEERKEEKKMGLIVYKA